ncbi:unnamed protein product [Cochlearia groenlandica]
MEPTTTTTSLNDDAEFWLPEEFLTDDDFLVEKENKVYEGDETEETSRGFGPFGLNSGLGSVDDDEENLLARLTNQMAKSTLEDDFSGGFRGGENNKVWDTTLSPKSNLCGSGIGCCCMNQTLNQTRVSSQAASSWDLYCAATAELAGKHPLTAAKNFNNGGSGFYNNHQSLSYQNLQAIQFQQLKQQQLMKHRRQMLQQSRAGMFVSNKNGGSVDLSPSAWSNQTMNRGGSGMRAVFLGNYAGKRGSTGTGVFLPRRVNHHHATVETRTKPTISTVLVPARVAQVLNLNVGDSVVKPVVRSNNGFGFIRQMKMEKPVKEPRLPSDWAY